MLPPSLLIDADIRHAFADYDATYADMPLLLSPCFTILLLLSRRCCQLRYADACYYAIRHFLLPLFFDCRQLRFARCHAALFRRHAADTLPCRYAFHAACHAIIYAWRLCANEEWTPRCYAYYAADAAIVDLMLLSRRRHADAAAYGVI